MVKEKKDSWFGIIIGIWISLLVFALLIAGNFLVIDDQRKDNYCEKVYPARVDIDDFHNPVWSSNEYQLETGYVYCCRVYWENHMKSEECEIFKYER